MTDKQMQAKLRQRWNRGFQQWLDKEHFYDCCVSPLCGYCDDNPEKGNPCVRALRRYLTDNNKQIDYTKAKYEDVWSGRYFE